MNALFSANLEICAVQVMSPSELDPELNDDSRFIDSESDLKLDITSGGDLLSIYHEHKDNFIKQLAETTRQRSGRFMTISSSDSISDIIFENLLRHGWVK